MGSISSLLYTFSPSLFSLSSNLSLSLLLFKPKLHHHADDMVLLGSWVLWLWIAGYLGGGGRLLGRVQWFVGLGCNRAVVVASNGWFVLVGFVFICYFSMWVFGFMIYWWFFFSIIIFFFNDGICIWICVWYGCGFMFVVVLWW